MTMVYHGNHTLTISWDIGPLELWSYYRITSGSAPPSGWFGAALRLGDTACKLLVSYPFVVGHLHFHQAFTSLVPRRI